MFVLSVLIKKEEIYLSPITKALYQYTCQTGKLKTLKRRQKVLLNTAIADRRRRVRWSNYSLPTGVVNRLRTQQGKNEVCPSNVVTNMRDDMTRKLSVLCRSQKEEWNETYFVPLSYLNPNTMYGEWNEVWPSVLRGSQYKGWNEVCPSFRLTSTEILGGEMKHYVSSSTCLNVDPSMRKKEKICLSPMTKTDIPTEMSNGQRDNTKTPWKCSITQRLWTDLGQSIEVATTTQLVWLTGLRAQRGEMKFVRLSVLRGSQCEEWNETVCPSVCLTWMPIMRGEIKWNVSVSLGSKIEGWNEKYFVRLSILRGSKFEWWNET